MIFDICLLGMGPDGHVASIFPEHPSSYAEGEVIAVRASPKPPPERISLTLPVINRSHEVWFVVSGSDKAAAAKMALLGAGPVQVPAARRLRSANVPSGCWIEIRCGGTAPDLFPRRLTRFSSSSERGRQIESAVCEQTSKSSRSLRRGRGGRGAPCSASVKMSAASLSVRRSLT